MAILTPIIKTVRVLNSDRYLYRYLNKKKKSLENKVATEIVRLAEACLILQFHGLLSDPVGLVKATYNEEVSKRKKGAKIAKMVRITNPESLLYKHITKNIKVLSNHIATEIVMLAEAYLIFSSALDLEKQAPTFQVVLNPEKTASSKSVDEKVIPTNSGDVKERSKKGSTGPAGKAVAEALF